MTQTKPKRRRTPKPEMSASEFAYCEDAINRHDILLDERYDYGLKHPDKYERLSDKVTEWYDLLLVRGGATQ